MAETAIETAVQALIDYAVAKSLITEDDEICVRNYLMEKTKNITLHISKADMGIVTAKKDDLVKGLNKDIEVDIIEDTSLEHNQCVIDFDTKVIDCSLDTQLKSLRDSLRMIAM